jgi:hypothetical protein
MLRRSGRVAERLRIVLLGGLGSMPFAGVAWQVLQYLEGFRLLGHDVFYLEDTGSWPYDPERETISDDARPTIAYLRPILERFGLSGSWGYRDVVRDSWHGVSEERVVEALGSADVLVNLSGVSVLREEHMVVPVRIYLETDPVLPQIEVAQGKQFTIDLLAAHTHHFSYGENFGAPDCEVPIESFHYLPTRPPVVLDWWPSAGSGRGNGRFTTISNWEQRSKDVKWRGRLYRWSKHREFLRFLEVPKLVKTPLELALALEDEKVVATLTAAGWHVVPAAPMSKDIDRYRDYIRSSAGEFSVAKEQYVQLRSGWFSDRTATYLASGRPAVVQDSGFGCALPVGEGLFAFTTADDILDAFGAIESDYARHSRAARRIAEDYLDSNRVLARLLADALGGGSAGS